MPKNLPRCRSADKFPDSLSMVIRPTSPSPSVPERLRGPEDECSAMSRHVSWGGAASTIRATYRFSSSSSRYVHCYKRFCSIKCHINYIDLGTPTWWMLLIEEPRYTFSFLFLRSDEKDYKRLKDTKNCNGQFKDWSFFQIAIKYVIIGRICFEILSKYF